MKIKRAPAFLRRFAKKHNQLVDGLQAGPGIRLHKSAGNIIVENSAPADASSAAEGAPLNVVGSDGKLNLVPKHSTWASPTAYPTVVKMVNGTKSITLDSTGITMTDTATGKSFTISFAALSQNLALRTDSFCDSGTTKSVVHVCSAPF